MGREFELKYRATLHQQQAIRAAFDGPWKEISMATAYYDTPTGELSRRKWTLRRRLEGTRSVCTLKTPDAGFGRREFEVECGDIHRAIDELCKLEGSYLLKQVCAEGLTEVCSARFTRQVLALTEQDLTVELALDRGVLQGGGRELPLEEAEVELKEGSEEAVLAFGQALQTRFGLEPEPKSKFRRALELAKGE